jgi:hypothetical protein
MEPLPSWMRRALYATAIMNVLAALGFLPGAGAVRALAGLPPDGQPLYLLTVALFVGLFGLGYLAAAVTGRPDRVFLGVAAAGKIGFFSLLLAFWLAGSVPLQAPVLGSADLAFGSLFVIWLFGSRAPA